MNTNNSLMKSLCSEDRAIINSLFNPLLPLGEAVCDEEPVECTADDEKLYKELARERNSEGVQATEAGRHQEALRAFQEAIQTEPSWGAPYNNRAQLYRIMRRNDDAIVDLDKALELSGGKGSVGCQAAIQRAALHRIAGEEDQARHLYTVAADLGSSYAKQQLVAMNPMAALCNKMLFKMVTDVKMGITPEVSERLSESGQA